MDTPRTTNSKALERVNVMLSRDVLLWLEKAASQIRENSGAKVNRSELIRGIVGGLMDWRLGLHDCRSEREIREGLCRYLTGLANRAELAKRAGL
jgi:hypothetical protein